MDRIETRLFVEQDLSDGASLELGADQAHYLRHVLRLSPMAVVAVFNGRDGEWLARIDGFGKRRASLTVDGLRRPQTVEPDIWILFAPIKRARIDFIAQKAAELGVARLCPVLTDRTMVDRVNVDRLRANAIEAAEQCERLCVPRVDPPARLDVVLDGWPEDRMILMGDESGSGSPIATALGEMDQARRARCALLIGPEGGFSSSELDRLHKLAFVTPVSLGPRLLRADTAALAMLTCWQALAGDWLSGRPSRPE